MLHINRIRLEVNAYPKNNYSEKQLFGFDISFYKGLNIIAGENTAGKSLTVSCIYYSLGVEQLLGGKNTNELDKALIKELEFQGKDYKVDTSSVYIELKNNQDEIVTLRRFIESNEPKKNHPNQKIYIYNSSLDIVFDKSNNTRKTTFIHSVGDHEHSKGFFLWFTSFVGIELPKVPSISKENGEAPLYMQLIFSSFFIEQTKGWSDFLATIPYLGIKRGKEKVLEFLLGLEVLMYETQIEHIKNEIDGLEKRWKELLEFIDLLAITFFGKTQNSPPKLMNDKKLIDDISIFVKKNSESQYQAIEELINELENEQIELENKPIKLVQENNIVVREEYRRKRTEYQVLQHKFDELEVELENQKNQLHSYKRMLKKTTLEKKTIQDIKKVITDFEGSEDIDTCPTCFQDVKNSLYRGKIEIKELTIEENEKYLLEREKLYKGSIGAIEKSSQENKRLQLTFLEEIEKKRTETKVLQIELTADDRVPSYKEVHRKVQLISELEKLDIILERLMLYKKEMYFLADRFGKLSSELDGLEKQNSDDIKKIERFETNFKAALRKYGYKSNKLDKVQIQKEAPFKYFPTIDVGGYPQNIKTSSSASDFIRTIWSYYTALMYSSPVHLKLLLFDEPGQHSVDSNSLKAFFSNLAKIKNEQIIVATSIEKQLVKDDKFNLDDLLDGLVEKKDYSIYKLPSGKKSAIHPIDSLK